MGFSHGNFYFLTGFLIGPYPKWNNGPGSSMNSLLWYLGNNDDISKRIYRIISSNGIEWSITMLW
jgi:hypothetical protein